MIRAVVLALIALPAAAQDCDPDTDLNGFWDMTSRAGAATVMGNVMPIDPGPSDPVLIQMDGDAGTITSEMNGNRAEVSIERLERGEIPFTVWQSLLPDELVGAEFTADEVALTAGCDLDALPQYRMVGSFEADGFTGRFEYDMVLLSNSVMWGYEEATLSAAGTNVVMRRTVVLSR